MSSLIYRLPLDILDRIALDLYDGQTSSPSAILPLLLTSKYFYDMLSFNSNSHIYARMFRICFDVSAPARRLGDLTATGLCMQLRANYDALKCIRRGNIYGENVVQTFWTCFSMLMENDGKNCRELDMAGLPDFVDRFIRERLYENSLNDWPAENEANSLALWLLWLTTTEERLSAETPSRRAQMTRLLFPYVLMPVRYAAYLAPHVHYTFPLPRNFALPPNLLLTDHGFYPQYRDGFLGTTPLYQINNIKLSVPLASVAAKLAYFSHRELFLMHVPTHLPRTRADAIQLGLNVVRPTQEDIQELNEHMTVKFVPESTWEWRNEIKDCGKLGQDARSKLALSTRWDDDWNRLVDCISLFKPVSLKRIHYTAGLLSGLWQGWMLVADVILYRNNIQKSRMPPAFGEHSIGLSAAPVFMRLREYHCMDVESNKPVASGGIQNAWFHSSMRFQEVTNGLSITCREKTSFYNEYIVGGPDLHDKSKCHGCGTSMVTFPDYVRYIEALDDTLANEGMGDEEDNDLSDTDVDMTPDKLATTRKCDGILDVVFVGETDLRHGQAWHHYKFYGRVRAWDGLIALIRVPVQPTSAVGTCIFIGYVVGGQNFVGHWRDVAKPHEPFEFAFAMSKRE